MSFKVDFSRFKKLSEDKHHTVMQHEDGHQLKIAHNALSAKTRKELSKLPMAEGGEVPTETQNLGKALIAAGSKEDTGLVNSIKVQMPAPMPKMMAEGGDPAEQMDAAPPAEIPPMEPAVAQAPEAISLAGPEGDKLKEAAGLPAETSVPNQGMAALDPNSPASATGMAPNAQQTSASPTSLGGYEKQVQGIKDEANAVTEVAKQQQSLAAGQALAAQNSMDEYQKHYKELDADRKAFQQDIINKHIDPNRYMASRTDGQRLAITVGLILGGLGASRGGPNDSLNILQSNIDRDINAQKAEIDKKETLLGANLKQFGNLDDATKMTKIQMADIYSAKLQEAAAKSNSPIALARAQQTIGQLEQHVAPEVQKLAVKNMLNSGQGMGGMDPAMLVTSLVPPDKQKEVFGQIEAAQNTKHMGNSIMKAFDDATKENTILKTGAGLLRTPASVYALHQAMQPTFKDLEGTVRQAAMDNTFKNITPQPGDSQHTIEQKRNSLAEYLQSKASAPMAKGFGIDLSKFDSTKPQENASEIRMVKGIPYQKVQGGWKKIG